MLAPLQIGVSPWLDDWEGPAHSLVEQAEFAEELGFHSFWLPESHFTGRTANPSPLLRLAAVASRTRRIGLGTTSYLLPVRHPIHVAEEVAVLDRLSEGRVILGVGRGFRKALFQVFDVPVKEKRDRLEAAVALMCAAWRGEPVAMETGADGAQTPVYLSPLPVQRPHPPIWMAGFGPKAVAQAGRLGFPYLASPIESYSRLEENYARHREAMSEEVRNSDLPVPIMRTVFVSSDRAVLERVREGLAAQAAALSSAQIASIRSAAASAIEDWAIVGEPDEVREQLEVYRSKLGMTHLIARGGMPGASREETLESLRALSQLAG